MPLGLPSLPEAATGEIVYELSLGGRVIPPETGLLSIVVERSVNRIASAQIILIDDDSSEEPYELSNQSYTEPGTEVEIKAGHGDEIATIFKGMIVGQSLKVTKRKSIMTLECKDKAVKMSIIKRSAYYYNQLDSDISTKLISDAGLTPDVEATTVMHKEMVQYGCSDWHFLVTRAEANGMVVFTTDGSVKIMKPPAAGSATITATYGQNIFEFDANMDARTQLKDVKSKAWDAAAQQMAEENSSEPVMATIGDIDGAKLGSSVADETCSQSHSGAIDTAQLKAWADARLVKSRLARMRGRVKIEGNAKALPGELIEIAGMGDRFSGAVMIAAVRHEIAKGNWLTDIQFGNTDEWYTADQSTATSQPAAALVAPVHGLQIGVVTALEKDPDGEYRIKVKVPVISVDEDGLWARQATPDAGNNRGWVVRPEIGDEVIVGFINDDPRHMVVLGALHSSANAAPIAATDDNDMKGWITRSDIKILIDDKKKQIEINTPAGNSLVMDEDAKKIILKDQNSNKIEMSSDGITIESAKDIILKATADVKVNGINIEATASAAFKSEGSASAEIKSGGQTTVKGSIVMIN
jgi:Rhs element Vgr protein